jgi:hypothetical protein
MVMVAATLAQAAAVGNGNGATFQGKQNMAESPSWKTAIGSAGRTRRQLIRSYPMCKTKPEQTPPFLLIRNDGFCIEFDDLQSLAATCREARISISRAHVQWAGLDYDPHDHLRAAVPWRTDNEWIVRDAMGMVLLQEDLKALAPPYRGYLTRRQDEIRLAQERNISIPHTGRSQRCYPRSHRDFRFLSVWRELLEQDRSMRSMGQAERPRGRLAEPFDPWLNRYETSHRASSYNRNWKQFRRTQWRERHVR